MNKWVGAGSAVSAGVEVDIRHFRGLLVEALQKARSPRWRGKTHHNRTAAGHRAPRELALLYGLRRSGGKRCRGVGKMHIGTPLNSPAGIAT